MTARMLYKTLERFAQTGDNLPIEPANLTYVWGEIMEREIESYFTLENYPDADWFANHFDSSSKQIRKAIYREFSVKMTDSEYEFFITRSNRWRKVVESAIEFVNAGEKLYIIPGHELDDDVITNGYRGSCWREGGQYFQSSHCFKTISPDPLIVLVRGYGGYMAGGYRCFVIPSENKDTLWLANGYGLATDVYSVILASMGIGLDITPSAPNISNEDMYINPSSIALHDRGESPNRDIEYTSADDLEIHSCNCDNCGDGVDEDYAYFSEYGEGPYCPDCYGELFARCHECECEISYRDSHEHDGDSYCDNCYSEQFTTCEECADTVHNDEIYQVGGDWYCSDCRDNLSTCSVCHEPYSESEFGGVCDECLYLQTNRPTLTELDNCLTAIAYVKRTHGVTVDPPANAEGTIAYLQMARYADPLL